MRLLNEEHSTFKITTIWKCIYISMPIKFCNRWKFHKHHTHTTADYSTQTTTKFMNHTHIYMKQNFVIWRTAYNTKLNFTIPRVTVSNWVADWLNEMNIQREGKQRTLCIHNIKSRMQCRMCQKKKKERIDVRKERKKKEKKLSVNGN